MSEALKSNIPNPTPQARQLRESGSSEGRKRRRSRAGGKSETGVLGSDWGNYIEDDIAQFDANFAALKEEPQPLDVTAGVMEKSDIDPELIRQANRETEQPSDRPRNMTEVKLGPAVPPPPMESKFARLDIRKDMTKTAILESELHSAVFNHLHADNLNAETARVVLDLAHSREPISCVRAGLTEMQRKNIWEPIIRGWWNSLGDQLRGKFIAAARRFDTGAEREVERIAARNIGYGRLLNNIFHRSPERKADLYDALKNGREPFCPEGFPDASCAEWREFVRTTWFAGLTAEERLRMDALSERRVDVPAERKQIIDELTAKRAELKKYTGLRGMWTKWTSTPLRMNRQGAEYPDQRLKSEIAALEARLAALEASTVIDQQIAVPEAKLDAAAEQTGLGSVSPDELFTWVRSDKGGVAQSLKGLILTSLNGTRHAVPAVVERWMVEAGSAHAASALLGEGKTSGATHSADELARMHRTVDEHGAPQIDWQAYLFAVQKNITAELAFANVRGQAYKSAIEKEPLKSLLKSYRDAAAHVSAAERERAGQFESFFAQITAETYGSLRKRGINPQTIPYVLPSRDQSWIHHLLDEHVKADASEPSRPAPHTPETHADLTDLRLRETIVAGPEFNLTHTILRMIKKFNPEKESVVATREAREFLRLGWVFEHGNSQRKAFYRDGEEWVHVYAGDRVTAVQNSEAPFGFSLEIDHKPKSQRDGYYLYRPDGVPEVYYERKSNGLVHVWEPDTQGKLHFIGYFEGKKFVQRLEREWKYTSTDGQAKKIYEFDDNIFFAPDGSVYAQREHGIDALHKLGSLPNGFTKEITVRQANGSNLRINLSDSKHRYYVTPRNTVVEYHASVNKMRELGKIES